MSLQALTWSIKQKLSTPTTKFVLTILANYADENGSCYPSEKKLAEIIGVSDRQIRRCLKNLVSLNLISIQERKGSSNRYFLNMEADVQTTMEADVHTGRKLKSYNTKEDTKDIYTDDFQKWWKIYPRKINKFSAAKSFKKSVKEVDVKNLIKWTEVFAEQIIGTEERFIPHASTWLNQKRWEDHKTVKKGYSMNSIAG